MDSDPGLGAAPQRSPQVDPPSFLGTAEQASRALAHVGRLRDVIEWRAHGGQWLLRGGHLWYRGLSEMIATAASFEEARAWAGDVFLPSPRDVIDELSRRGFDVITSPTRFVDKPLRVVARRNEAPLQPPIEVTEQTLYLALLGVLVEVVSQGSPGTSHS